MADTLRYKDEGQQVKALQTLLNKTMCPDLGPRLDVDGDFGELTETRLELYQSRRKLLVDGVAGRQVWRELVKETALFKKHQIVSLSMDRYGEGYRSCRLRDDTASKVKAIRAELNELGGMLTTSGGTRSLGAPLSASRSATSFHYSGRAFDMYIWSGMCDPAKDPYVVVKEEDRYWRVYARVTAKEVPETELLAYTNQHDEIQVTGRFVDLTRMFEARGMKRIRARRSFFRGGSKLGSEWWHFQDESGLKPGMSFFGHEVASIYSERELQGTRVWLDRDYLFGVDWH